MTIALDDRPRGACSVCGRVFILTKTGKIRIHGLKVPGIWPPHNCPGNGLSPVPGEETP